MLRCVACPLRALWCQQANANQAELQELEATEQHLKRQQASLTERLSRLENQSALKREAAASAVEEQLKEKEAIEAENAAARAKTAENEAMVSDKAVFSFAATCLQMLKLEVYQDLQHTAETVCDNVAFVCNAPKCST